MVRGTKKVGIAGKFGARYGVKVRKNIANIENMKRGRHVCPRCKYRAVRRSDTAIWQCHHCQHRYTSGAYNPNLRRNFIRSVAAREEEAALTAAEEL